jgi:RNA polymerase sigma-70 factor (ECF subfamily)
MSHSDRYDEFVRALQEASPRILAYLDALLLNWNDAEDVFQESCIVLWQKFGEFQPRTNFVAWAIRIAQNKAMHLQRSRERQIGLWNSELQDALMAAVAEGEPARQDDALAALSDCMGQLPDGDRQLVRLCYGDGVPVRQMAVELGRSPQSVHNSLRRIRTTLLECVERVMNQEERR